MTLSVVLITYNEEANIRRTLESVLPLVRPREGSPEPQGEIIVVDNGSTDRTVEIARELGAKVFIEDWKGFAAQKNSAVAKAAGDWILSLDADESVSSELLAEVRSVLSFDALQQRFQSASSETERQSVIRELKERDERLLGETIGDNYGDWQLVAERALKKPIPAGYFIPRKNLFLSRWIKHAGFWPDKKLRLFRRSTGAFEPRPVHEVLKVQGGTGTIKYGALLHNAYPTLTGYIATMNKYSSLGAEVAAAKGHSRFSFLNIVIRPLVTFISMYLLRLGFLDGREGLLLCLYHSVYVSWKYAKAWELSRSGTSNADSCLS